MEGMYDWVYPVTGTVSSLTGWRSRKGGENHGGVDIAAPIGTPIYAACDGVVRQIGGPGFGDFAPLITVDEKYYTNKTKDPNYTGAIWYGHVSKVFVKTGDRVTTGQKIALVGNEGESDGPHLHFELNVYNEKGKKFHKIVGNEFDPFFCKKGQKITALQKFNVCGDFTRPTQSSPFKVELPETKSF